ncbi:MAG: type II toxin-antitoxin system PemK/MazF family toxin [Janthinobacterium lividum]
MVIRQGEIYWADLGTPQASKPRYQRPVVIVQGNSFNRSRLATTVVCVLSSNLERADSSGNVLLNPGECHLPKQSVVLISQVYTIDKTQLEEQIGILSRSRMKQVLDGLRMLIDPDGSE